MNVKHFTDQQRQALLDLSILAMYADGHLATAEDEGIHQLLRAMGFDTDDARAAQYDAAIARVSKHSQTTAAAHAHIATLGQNFTTREHRRRVHDILDDLLSSDKRVTPAELSYLAVVREAIQI